MDKIILILTSGAIGLFHTLAPPHWIPLAMMIRTRRWDWRQSAAGVLVAATGHVLVSGVLGGAVMYLGFEFLIHYGDEVEHKSGLVLIIFGLLYALWGWRNHHHCGSGEHHHPANPGKDNHKPYVFLFFMGLSPCVIVWPVFIEAAPLGLVWLAGAVAVFSIGVIIALSLIGFLVHHGRKLKRLDHPWLEHYGDAITGVVVALVGLIFYLGGLDVGHPHS